MSVISKYLVFPILIYVYSLNALAIVVITEKIVVDRSNSNEYSIDFWIDKSDFACGNGDGISPGSASKIFANFPETFRGYDLLGSELTIIKDGALITDTSLITFEGGEIGPFNSYFGSEFCIGNSLLPFAMLTLTYGAHGLVSYEMDITELEAWVVEHSQ